MASCVRLRVRTLFCVRVGVGIFGVTSVRDEGESCWGWIHVVSILIAVALHGIALYAVASLSTNLSLSKNRLPLSCVCKKPLPHPMLQVRPRAYSKPRPLCRAKPKACTRRRFPHLGMRYLPPIYLHPLLLPWPAHLYRLYQTRREPRHLKVRHLPRALRWDRTWHFFARCAPLWFTRGYPEKWGKRA